MPISSLGGFGGQAGRDDRPVAKGNGHRVRSGLAAGGRLIRTIGTPAEFFLAAPSIPQFTFRNINRLPRDRAGPTRMLPSVSRSANVPATKASGRRVAASLALP